MNAFSFSLILTGVLLNAAAQLLLKAGTNQLGVISFTRDNVLSLGWQLGTQPHIFGGLSCYVISVVVWIMALSRVEVSIAYPMLSIGYVVNAIAAHHEEVKAETVYAGLVILADTISAVRPGARAESMTGYVQRLERLENLALSMEGVQQAYAIQAGREVRVVVNPQTVTDEQARELAKQLRRKIEEELQYPSTIKVTVIREQRFNETAM